MNPARSLWQWFLRRLRARGYEVYKRPYLPKGADAFLSLTAHWPAWQPHMIFDVGANVGQTVGRLRLLFPAAQIVCFEPVPAAYARLQHFVAGDQLVRTHPLALSDAPGEAMIHLHGSIEQCSITPALLAQLDPAAPRLRVPLETLTGFCARQGIARIDLLKIDVEGHELAVLRGAREMLAAGAIDFIVAEAGLTGDNARFAPLHELAEFLRPYGFWPVGVYEQFGHRFQQSAEFCNAAFVREKFLTASPPP